MKRQKDDYAKDNGSGQGVKIFDDEIFYYNVHIMGTVHKLETIFDCMNKIDFLLCKEWHFS